jgi:cytochrome c oxidase subunit 4
MSAHAMNDDVHFSGSNRLFISVWVWLLALTGFEVLLGYKHVPLVYMLTILMGVSIIKAALIVAYFMHLRFERLNLVLTIVPALVICICLMLLVFFPDSFRARDLRDHKTAPPAAESH